MFVFGWINVFTNTLFIISTPANVYLDENISILGGLETEILTRIQIWSRQMFFCCWIIVFTNTLFIISTPEKSIKSIKCSVLD